MQMEVIDENAYLKKYNKYDNKDLKDLIKLDFSFTVVLVYIFELCYNEFKLS